MGARTGQHRPLAKMAAGLAVVTAGLVGFGSGAGADSQVSKVTAGSCVDGTVDRNVVVSYSTLASFTTGVRIHVVSGKPDGSVVEVHTIDLQGPASITIPLTLPGGIYYFDWEDRAGDGVSWSGRHSGLGSFYNGIYLATKTEVAECLVVSEPATTTTTIAPAGPSIPATAQPVTTTVVTALPPSTAQTATTPLVAPPTATARATTPATLAATGNGSGPLVLAGVAFLFVGAVALTLSRRRPETVG